MGDAFQCTLLERLKKCDALAECECGWSANGPYVDTRGQYEDSSLHCPKCLLDGVFRRVEIQRILDGAVDNL